MSSGQDGSFAKNVPTGLDKVEFYGALWSSEFWGLSMNSSSTTVTTELHYLYIHDELRHDAWDPESGCSPEPGDGSDSIRSPKDYHVAAVLHLSCLYFHRSMMMIDNYVNGLV